jgi:hypothetical protein
MGHIGLPKHALLKEHEADRGMLNILQGVKSALKCFSLMVAIAWAVKDMVLLFVRYRITEHVPLQFNQF